MNNGDILISKIKELSKKLADDNITFPVEEDYLLIEQAILLGASLAFQLSMEEEKRSITNEKTEEITTKDGNHGYVYVEQLIDALKNSKQKG